MYTKFFAKVLISIIILTPLVLPLSSTDYNASFFNIAEAAEQTDVWWPIEGTRISGLQPFKAQVYNSDITTYTMYWQVDGGQLNLMENNYTDYPHKESIVNLTNWTWNTNETYTVNFVSKNKGGKTISERKVTFTVPKPAPSPVITTTSTNTSNSNTTTNTTSSASSTTGTTDGTTETQPETQPFVTVAPEPIVIYSTESTNISGSEITTPVDVWWPANNANITGPQPFKATLPGVKLIKYNMYWQVDGREMHLMNDSLEDAPHKESSADVNWNWDGIGPYTVTFIARDARGIEINRKSVRVSNPKGNIIINPGPTIVTPITTVAEPTPPIDQTAAIGSAIGSTVTPASTVATTDNPLSGVQFYTNPNSNAKRQADSWRTTRPIDAAMMDKIAANPDAKWLGNWNANVQADAKAYTDQAVAIGATPVFIAYNIPGRDCGSYSAGGAESADHYKTWIRGVANGIGTRKAAVILEPDALAGITCLDTQGQASRISLLKDAITVLKAKGNITVYLDAGHSNWIGAADMATRLKNAGVALADGFALNVSNYNWTADQIPYGTTISSLIGNKHFVVDTSRNGKGPLGSEWCNPQGRGLGKPATTNTGNPLIDAYMWLKNPGESDGTCNGGPSAGVWWPEYALGLAQKAEF